MRGGEDGPASGRQSCRRAWKHRNTRMRSNDLKTMLTKTDRLALNIPRDRQGTFDRQLIAKYQSRFPGFDEKIVSMYAREMSGREVQGPSVIHRSPTALAGDNRIRYNSRTASWYCRPRRYRGSSYRSLTATTPLHNPVTHLASSTTSSTFRLPHEASSDRRRSQPT
jgi:Transposase, Mutator family